MRAHRFAWLAAGVLLLGGCADDRLPVEPATAPVREEGPPAGEATPPQDGVGTFGEIVEIKPNERGLVLYQTGLEFREAEGVRVRGARHEMTVGGRHQRLQVQLRDSTEIWVHGKRATVDSLAAGQRVLVVGRVTGAALHADQILDLADAGPPPADWQARVPLRPAPAVAPPVARPLASPMVQTVSMCMGQRLPDHGAGVLEFQGCWGGPSAADHVNVGFIPVFCPLIGCFGIDRLSYMAALAGWGYAFPFRFEAVPAQSLVYHVPSDVDLKITPLGAGDAVSFWGGLGLDLGIGFRWCGIFGCYDLGMKYLSVFTAANQSSGAAPLAGQYLDIATTSCPSVGVVPIENFPLNPLEIGFCQDLDLEGRGFQAQVYASGAQSPALGLRSFGPTPIRVKVRPVAMDVAVRYSGFRWVPELKQSLFFRFRSFTVKLFDTPAIPLGSGAWDAITTPFPTGVFTVATDPRSPIDDLRYLFHPTQATALLDVQPAATRLSITSPAAVAEGAPITAWLREQYQDAPIAGAPVVFSVTGLNGSPSTSASVATDAEGVARLLLRPGEYAVVASYAGGETYLPSRAEQEPLYVYRPTTFVIWGGNADGVQTGARYQFWGARWVRQVTGGDYQGNPSFQGFSIPQDETTWVSPPAASSPRMPDSVPDVIGVIVTTRVSGRGSWSTGNIAAHAVLRVEHPEWYRPAAGHEGWGVLRLRLP